MLIRWKNKDKDKEKCEKGSSQKQNSTMGTSKKKRKFGRDGEEEWNSDSKSGRGNDSGRSDNEGVEVRSGRSRAARSRDDHRRHTLGADQQYHPLTGQGGPLSRTMDLEGQPRGYPPPSNAMLFDDDPGIMSEVETSSTGFRRGGKQRSSLPVVRTPSKTLERPLGLVFLQYRNETKRALLPNEITSIDTVKALFVRSFPKQLTMEYMDSPNVKIYIHDSSKDMFYELEDLRSHLREIRDRSVLRLFESADVSGGLPIAGIGISAACVGGIGILPPPNAAPPVASQPPHFDDPSYFSEPEFDSEYQHQHIHKTKSKGPPYYMGSTASLPRGAALLRTYSPAVASLSADRMKSVPADGYMSSPERSSRYEDPYYSQYAARSGSITPVIDEEISDTELLDDSYSLYGMKIPPSGGGVPPRVAPRSPFAPPAAVPPYDATRLRVENMERQLANLTGLVQKALTQPVPAHLQVPGRDSYRDDTYLRSDSKAPKLGKTGCHKSVSFEKSVSFSDEPPDMNSPKQHSPQHTADTKPAKPAIKSSTLPRTSSQERDGRLKPAPSKPMPLNHSGSYDGSTGAYRDLQLTAETYNQLRCLQKKAKELRAEARNLRRMSQAQAHSVKETVRDAFIKIRAVLMAGGEQLWQTGMDQERVRLSREEDLYKQEMMRLEKDLSDLESTVEELRGNVINRKTRVNMSDVENMALILSKSSKTVADLKLRFPGLQDSMKSFLNTEMEKMMREEKFLKEEPERLESALRRCKKLTGTLVTLKRLASVQEQRLPCSNSVDGRLSPSTETPPITPSSTHSKGVRMGSVSVGGDPGLSPVGGGSPGGGSESGGSCSGGGNACRPENALDALLDELQTFSRPAPSTAAAGQAGNMAADGGGRSLNNREGEQQRKGSMDSQQPHHPPAALQVTPLPLQPGGVGLRRLHSYPSGSDTDNSPPIQPLKAALGAATGGGGGGGGKPPLPERTDASGGGATTTASGKRMPPPPPPRTSSKSPIASPTSPRLPPRAPVSANNPAVHNLQHIQNVQQQSTSSDESSCNSQAKAEDKPALSQFEQATQNLGLQTLRRSRGLSQGGTGGDQSQGGSLQYNSKPSDRSQTLPRNLGSTLLQAAPQPQAVAAAVAAGDVVSNSSSCESINSQDGGKNKTRKEELEQRHQELLKKQKALQEQYARLQQLQRGTNALAVIPPDQLLKKTGSESNLLQKMGLQLATQQQMTGSLTNLPAKAQQLQQQQQQAGDGVKQENVVKETKVYETDIL